MNKPILWVHGDCLSPNSPAFVGAPDAAAVFVWDDALLKDWGISLKRIAFIYECLLELPVTIRRGDVAVEVAAFAHQHDSDSILTVESPSPRFRAIAMTLMKTLPVYVVPVEPFVEYEGEFDLKSFSRYWSVAQRYV